MPLVTVIVVTINNLNLLRNCLGSLYAQDYGAIEIIVVDNGSEEDVRGMPVPNLTEPEEVLTFNGCACLLRMDALKEIGLFDEDFFAYCEDTDLGLRLRWSGWKIVVAPGAYAHHFYSITGGRFSLRKIYWVERNHLWLAIKNFPRFLIAILPFVTAWRYLLQGYFVLRGIGELKKFTEGNNLPAIALTYFKAYINMSQKLPAMFAKRRSLLKKRRLGNIDMFNLIRRFRLSMGKIMGY